MTGIQKTNAAVLEKIMKRETKDGGLVAGRVAGTAMIGMRLLVDAITRSASAYPRKEG